VSISKQQFRRWALIQVGAFVLGCALWFYFMESSALQAAGNADTDSGPPAAPPGGFPILIFLLFRLLPAGAGFVVLMVTEWLLFTLISSEKN
jgi:hypothetical protein